MTKSLFPRAVLTPMGSRLEFKDPLTLVKVARAAVDAASRNTIARNAVVTPVRAAHRARELKSVNIGVRKVNTNARIYPNARNVEVVLYEEVSWIPVPPSFKIKIGSN